MKFFTNWVFGDGLPIVIIVFAWMVVSFILGVAEHKKITPRWVSWLFTAFCLVLLVAWYLYVT